MELTSFTDYSLRVLMYLAKHQPERSSIDELAEFYKISRHHLAKIIKRLSQLGYVETIRGKGGGVCLALAPERINLAKVIRGTEPHFNLVECFAKESAGNCVIHGNCALKGVLWRAQGHFFEHLEKYTLADVV
ncbi:MAG TPA: Rrf2 family transcriptional regulator [Opitutae bacterium]|nr:Rrf2 family transcriptional regulator [Opitutae bacterium]